MYNIKLNGFLQTSPMGSAVRYDTEGEAVTAARRLIEQGGTAEILMAVPIMTITKGYSN